MKVTLSFEVDIGEVEDLVFFAQVMDSARDEYVPMVSARARVILYSFFQEPLPALMAYLHDSLGEECEIPPDMLRRWCEDAIREYERLTGATTP